MREQRGHPLNPLSFRPEPAGARGLQSRDSSSPLSGSPTAFCFTWMQAVPSLPNFPEAASVSGPGLNRTKPGIVRSPLTKRDKTVSRKAGKNRKEAGVSCGRAKAGASAREITSGQNGASQRCQTEPGHKTEPPGTAEQWACLQRNVGRVSAPADQGPGGPEEKVSGNDEVQAACLAPQQRCPADFRDQKKMKDCKELRQDR